MEQVTQQTDLPMNSRQWWDEFFEAQWSANGGSDQTRHFMKRLIESLPQPEIAYLDSTPSEILDWGCAFGEGVDLLARRFPKARVTGLDFAPRAVEEARRRHPEYEYVLTEDGRIPRDFDVIVTSNCLEHFDRPLEVMAAHLRSCRKFYVALVPYDEYPLCEYHRSQFRAESFPERVGGFVRLAATPIDVDPAHWTGQQLLVVYGSPAYLAERSATAVDITGGGGAGADAEREKWDRLYADMPLNEEDEATRGFNQEFAAWASALLPNGGRVLEAGCGAGWQSLALARTGRFEPTLMDFSTEALSYARRLFERERADATFVQEDVFTPGQPEYDLVFNAGVLEHYTPEQQAAFLRSMASRSRRYVMVLVPNRSCYWYWLWRVQKSAAGEWPYGKEVPLADLSAAFAAAGLHFVGQRVGGAAWTEAFIRTTSGLDPALVEQILQVHRSPLIEDYEKGYLLAALGSVTPQAGEASEGWSPLRRVEGSAASEAQAALADTLALRVAGEAELRTARARLTEVVSRHRSELDQRDETVRGLRAEVDRLEAECRRVGEDLVWYDATNRQLEKRLWEVGESLRPKLAAREAEVRDLRGQLAAAREQLQAAERRRESVRAALAREQDARGLLEKGIRSGYQDLVRRAPEVVAAVAPRDATVLVVSKGDRALLELGHRRRAWHFPREEDGQYAGHHPANSAAAIEHLESLRARGAGFLLLPNTAFWWLDHYADFADHLDGHYRRVWDDGRFLVYDLRGGGGGATAARDARGRRWPRLAKRLTGLLVGRQNGGGSGVVADVPQRAGSPRATLADAEPRRTHVEPAAAPEAAAPPAAEDHAQAFGHVVIFAGVPYDDIGGGQRSAQLARAFLRRHWRVTYVYAFERADMTTGTKVRSRVRSPRLDQRAVDETSPPELLSVMHADTPVVFEIPHRRFLPFAELAWARGLPTTFELIDDWESSLGAGWFDREVMEQFVRRCTVCVGTARVLVDKLRALGAAEPKYVPNGADETVFDAYKDYPRPDDYPAGYRRSLLYFGSMYGDWFAWDYLGAAAAANPGDAYVMIGDPPRTHAMPANVIFLGPKQNTELPAYLAAADAAIIPFVPSPLVDAVSPVKAFEYLFLKKPVVATRMPELDGYPNVRQAATPAEFARFCTLAVSVPDRDAKPDPEQHVQLDLFIARNSWGHRIQMLLPPPRRCTRKRFSFIVLIHNNRRIVGRNLASLTEHCAAAGVDAEIIVVDNASTDGGPDLVAREFPHVKLLRNEKNGCSTGRNLGAAAATGDYLVFLDSDQWFTSAAWIAEAEHILSNHASVGAVGWAAGWFDPGLDSLGGPTVDQMSARGHNAEVERRGFRTDVTYLGSGGLFVPRPVWEQCGGFDPSYDPHAFEDTDFSFEVRKAGFQLAYRDLTGIRHQPHQTTCADGEGAAAASYRQLFERNSEYFKRKWADYLDEFLRRPAAARPQVDVPRAYPEEPAREQPLTTALCQIALSSLASSKLPILHMSPVDWGMVLFQRPHQMVRALGALGQPTVYLTPNYDDGLDGARELGANCYLLPRSEFGRCRDVLDRFVLVLLSTDPHNPAPEELRALRGCAIIVYDFIDELHEDIHPVPAEMRESHEYLLRHADLVVATADSLYEQATAVAEGKVILCPNGADVSHFRLRERPPVPQHLAPIVAGGRPIIGYFGALAKWFDYELIRKIAAARAGFEVVLIGADYDGSVARAGFAALPNVHYLGTKPYDLLPHYAAYFDVAAVPFVLNNVTQSTSPIKLFEYMACRKPIVTTDLRECRKYRSVLIGKSHDEYVSKLDEALRLREDPEYLALLDREANENSWLDRARHLSAEIERLSADRGWNDRFRMPATHEQKGLHDASDHCGTIRRAADTREPPLL